MAELSDVGVRPPLTSKLDGFGTTIFAEMSALATATGAINLGQGFPDTDGPAEVLEAAVVASTHWVQGPRSCARRSPATSSGSTASPSIPRPRCW
jgi:hypothetical protein